MIQHDIVIRATHGNQFTKKSKNAPPCVGSGFTLRNVILANLRLKVATSPVNLLFSLTLNNTDSVPQFVSIGSKKQVVAADTVKKAPSIVQVYTCTNSPLLSDNNRHDLNFKEMQSPAKASL